MRTTIIGLKEKLNQINKDAAELWEKLTKDQEFDFGEAVIKSQNIQLGDDDEKFEAIIEAEEQGLLPLIKFYDVNMLVKYYYVLSINEQMIYCSEEGDDESRSFFKFTDIADIHGCLGLLEDMEKLVVPPQKEDTGGLYEFITPSDDITFKASSNKVAFLVGVVHGQGKAGVKKIGGHSFRTMLAFSDDAESIILETLGMPLEKYLEANKQDVADAFRSFAYCNADDRSEYDYNLQQIKDESDRKEAKETHEKENRTSINTWVLSAWEMADYFMAD